ncbi:hypothetical protein LPB140_07920 [Sphingorhabdus lutea]|uniref:SDR family NAD(P)-dependent oxidoreductase n=1 Tax=Sphingorhabdus lutea TaxID=1913578 RepID=A0A1L3JC53_9SPHN|nr:SDR family NAD(P)-dependent oxidoreductase [Sphingorhabdus lutea]APG62727.1 hypothetical protein LPB140_07920 [Sphingorhabdus lutea]
MLNRKIDAAIIGANGAIGTAIVENLRQNPLFDSVFTLSRHDDADIKIDIINQQMVESAAKQLQQKTDKLAMIIIASGILHNQDMGPEKSITQIDAEWMKLNYEINVIGPALVAKYFLPVMMKKSPIYFAAISAKIGSISDNGLGGWHSYRASKAALNMLVKNLAIEWTRKNPQSVILALHPGTVKSNLSKPFQHNVAPEKLFSAAQSAQYMIHNILSCDPALSGNLMSWDGSIINP